jgi:hypothetical protein
MKSLNQDISGVMQDLTLAVWLFETLERAPEIDIA